MAKTRTGRWFAAPLLVVMMALVFAPAAFGIEAATLQAAALETQAEEAAGEETTPIAEPDEYYSFGIGADLDNATLTFTDSKTQTYTGKAIKPKFTVTLDGQELKGTTNPEKTTADFYYFYMDNVVVGKGNATAGTGPRVLLVTFDTDGIPHIKTAAFTIKQAAISKATAKAPSQVYTGKKLKPSVTVKFNKMTLKQGKDYTLKYSSNVKAGKGKITITGKGQYKGTKKITFKIKKASISKAKFSSVKSKTYTGKALKPSVTVKFKGKKLKKGKDYTVTYSKNTNAGVAKMKVKGKGNMKGSHTLEFVIHPRAISKAKLTVGKAVWTGGFVTPSVTLKDLGKTLKQGKDYTVLFYNNTDASSKAKLRITAWGNYTGTYTKTFTIEAKSIKASDVDAHWENPITHATVTNPLYLSGSKPYPTIKYKGRSLRYGIEYDLAWIESADGKTGTLTITGKGNFNGSRTLTYSILKTA